MAANKLVQEPLSPPLRSG